MDMMTDVVHAEWQEAERDLRDIHEIVSLMENEKISTTVGLAKIREIIPESSHN